MKAATPGEKPAPNSYWVVPNRLAAGEYPGAKPPQHKEAVAKVTALLDAGIDHCIDLTEPEEELSSYVELANKEARHRGVTIGYERWSIPDVDVPRTPGEMVAILDAIDAALVGEKTVYVHCWGGVGRTGTVIGCWLVRHGSTASEALAQVAEGWQGMEKFNPEIESPEAPRQREYVRNWSRAEPLKSSQQFPLSPGSTAKSDGPAVSRRVSGNCSTPHQGIDFVSNISVRNRFRGCLSGLAAGDALGTTLEFMSPGSFEPIDDMVGGGCFGLQPGQWTDDTSMALCLATSLVESGGFDPIDQMTRYVRWWREGYLSSTGRCFDIGNTTCRALSRFEETGEPFAGLRDPDSAGNGSLMRLAPVPMFFAGDPAEAIERSADSSKTTHGTEEAVDACRYFSGLLVGALNGVDKATLLSDRYCPVEGHWRRNPLAERIDAVAAGSFKDKEPPEIKGEGYVVRSLEAALWAFHRSMDFRDGALLAVNLGDDADTTGAIYGQIAGAHYGIEAIPAQWRQWLAMSSEIESLADRLHDAAMTSGHQGSTSR